MAGQQGVGRAAPGVLTQAVYATLLERGEIDRHLRRTRRAYHSRRNALIDALAEWLPETTVGGAAAGLHVIVWLPDGSSESAISDAATSRGVAISTPCTGRLRRDGTAAPSAGARVRSHPRAGDPARRSRASGGGRALEADA